MNTNTKKTTIKRIIALIMTVIFFGTLLTIFPTMPVSAATKDPYLSDYKEINVKMVALATGADALSKPGGKIEKQLVNDESFTAVGIGKASDGFTYVKTSAGRYILAANVVQSKKTEEGTYKTIDDTPARKRPSGEYSEGKQTLPKDTTVEITHSVISATGAKFYKLGGKYDNMWVFEEHLVQVTNSKAEEVVKIARAEVGYKEGSNNWNKYAPEIGHAQNQAWCATFVSWVMKKANVSTDIVNRSAVAYTVGNIAPKLSDKYKAQPGDLVYFTWSHVGIVDRVENGKLYVIDGNYSDKVNLRICEWGDVSYIRRPKY